MKTALPKTFLRPVVSGFRYSRGATDTNVPTAPTPSSPIPRSGALSLQWVCGIDADTGVDSTTVEVSTSGDNDWHATVVPYPGTALIVTGLLGQTPYDVRYSTLDSASPQNRSAYTAIQTVTTLATDPALEPGNVSLVSSTVTINEGQPLTVAVQRAGAGVSSPALEADWNITGLSEGTPSPANGTLSWAAGENGIKTISTTAGAVTQDRTGTLSLAALRSLSGIIPPSYGLITSAALTVREVGTTGHKWNPGFYMGSDNWTFANDRKLANQTNEDNVLLASGSRVLGKKNFYYPSIFGNDLANPDFSKIVRDLNKLRSMTTPKRLMITIIPQIFNSTAYADLLPSVIYNDSSYGASPVAGKYGWWTMDGGTDATIAWWRPAVMDWIISVFQKLAATVNATTGLTLDADPYVEQTAFGETSMGVDAGSDYNDIAVVTQYKRLIDAIIVAWPRTVHMCNNNYNGTIALTQQLTDYCKLKGVAQGGPDTYAPGQKKPELTNGQAAALGIASGIAGYTGPDLRGQIGMQSDTQGPEISNASRYKMYTPITFFNQVNNVLQQSHMVVTYTSGSADPIPAYPVEGLNTGANPGNWQSFLQVFNGNTLTHTAKPSGIS